MPELTDEQVATKARRYVRAKRLEKRHADRKAALGLELRTELDRRGVDRFEELGVRILVKAPTTKHFAGERVLARLGRAGWRFLFLGVDTNALKAAQKAGEISAEDMAECIGAVTTGQAYVDVSDLEAA